MLTGAISVGIPFHARIDLLDLTIKLCRDKLADHIQCVFAVKPALYRGEGMHFSKERFGKITAKQVIAGVIKALFGFLHGGHLSLVLIINRAIRSDVHAFQGLGDLIEFSDNLVETIKDADIGRPEHKHTDFLIAEIADRYFNAAIINGDDVAPLITLKWAVSRTFTSRFWLALAVVRVKFRISAFVR